MHASRTSHLLGPTRFVGPSRWEVREVGGQWRGEPLRQIQWSLWRQRVCSSSWHPVSCVCEKMLWERSETKVVTALRLRKRGNRKDLFACLVCHLSAPDNSERLLQSKTSNLVKWTKLISADFPRFSAFYYTSTSGAFPYTFLFRKEPFKYMGDLWIHSTDITWKRSSESEFWGEFGKSIDFFCEQIWSCDRRYTCITNFPKGPPSHVLNVLKGLEH